MPVPYGYGYVFDTFVAHRMDDRSQPARHPRHGYEPDPIDDYARGEFYGPSMYEDGYIWSNGPNSTKDWRSIWWDPNGGLVRDSKRWLP